MKNDTRLSVEWSRAEDPQSQRKGVIVTCPPVRSLTLTQLTSAPILIIPWARGTLRSSSRNSHTKRHTPICKAQWMTGRHRERWRATDSQPYHEFDEQDKAVAHHPHHHLQPQHRHQHPALHHRPGSLCRTVVKGPVHWAGWVRAISKHVRRSLPRCWSWFCWLLYWVSCEIRRNPIVFVSIIIIFNL